MSRLYDNTPLTNLPVHTVKWNGNWNHAEWTKSTKDRPGVIYEGKVLSQARISISGTPESAAKARYYLLFTKIDRAHKRKYDDKGNEIEPNFSETTKVSTGYLNSSYDVKAKGKTDRLTPQEVKSLVENSKISDMISEVVEKTQQEGDLILLMREEDRDKIELFNDVPVRIKTAGDSPFVESLVMREDLNAATTGNYVGDEKLGDTWTNKIMAVKSTLGDQAGAQETSEIGEDEWDD